MSEVINCRYCGKLQHKEGRDQCKKCGKNFRMMCSVCNKVELKNFEEDMGVCMYCHLAAKMKVKNEPKNF